MRPSPSSGVIAAALLIALIATTPAGRLDGWTRQGVVGGIPPGGVPAPLRDPQANVRRIPIGTASISGTVTTADTGRPVRGARVTVTGSTALAVGRGAGVAGGSVPASGPAGSSGSSAPPVGARSQGPGAVVQPPAAGATSGRSGASGGLAQGIQVVMNGSPRTTVTDDLGNFSIERLPAGQYSVSVSVARNTYLAASYGQKKPGGPGSTFPLADGQKAKVNIQMTRGGVITGTVYGEDGDPLSGAQVRAWRYSMNNGVKRLQTTTFATADDRGIYRLFGLQPGDYLVSATPESVGMSINPVSADAALIEQAIAAGNVTPPAGPGLPATVSITMPTLQQQAEQRQLDGPPPGYLPVYHPDTPVTATAGVIHVTGGDERPGIDIQVRLVQASNIQGTIANPPGQELGVQLSLVNDDPVSESNVGTRADNNGRFTFRNVAPGKYTIQAQVVAAQTITIVNGVSPQMAGPQRQLSDAEKKFGRTVISVEGQPIVNASVTLKPGRSISGQVIFEMTRPPDLTRAKMTVGLSSAPGAQSMMFGALPQADLGPDGRFTMNGVMPGKYIFRAPGGFTKSAMVNGQDVLDFPLDFTGERDVTDAVLTVTDQMTEVSGVLTDKAGKPALEYSIIAAAAEERFWTPGSRRVAIARPGPDGRYVFRNLPAGNYLLAAVTDLESGAQYDPDFLKGLSTAGAMRITISDGGKISQDLQIAEIGAPPPVIEPYVASGALTRSRAPIRVPPRWP